MDSQEYVDLATTLSLMESLSLKIVEIASYAWHSLEETERDLLIALIQVDVNAVHRLFMTLAITPVFALNLILT